MNKELVNFGAGLLFALATPISTALVTVNNNTLDNPSTWLAGLVVGCLVTTGLYLKDWAAKHESN